MITQAVEQMMVCRKAGGRHQETRGRQGKVFTSHLQPQWRLKPVFPAKRWLASVWAEFQWPGCPEPSP